MVKQCLESILLGFLYEKCGEAEVLNRDFVMKQRDYTGTSSFIVSVA